MRCTVRRTSREKRPAAEVGTGGVLSAPEQATGVSDGDGDPTDERGSTDDTDGFDVGASGAGSDPAADDTNDTDSASATDPARNADPAENTHDDYAVPTETDSDAETAWRRELAEAGELTPSAVDALIKLHDGRGARAIEAVSEGRIKRYRDFTVVVGHEDEYVVEDGGCTCKDSAYNLDPENPHERCWHVLAVAIAERIGEVDYHEMWYSEVREFI
jgi:predicted nucleic acid-binding Zn finger protein